MTRRGIESRSPGLLVNTLLIRSMYITRENYKIADKEKGCNKKKLHRVNKIEIQIKIG